MKEESITILVVENCRKMQRKIAQQLGDYFVHIVSTGQEAIEQVAKHTYHLLLIQENLPFMNGVTLLNALGHAHSAIPSILIFEKEDPDHIHFAKQAGALEYILRKEITRTTVLPRLIYHILTRHHLGSQFLTLQNEMREVALIDPLTQAYNRHYLEQRLLIEVAQAKARQEALTAVMIDVDDFKLVNDYFGHLMGDIVLKELAHTIRRYMRISDTLCRYGGDEFLLLFPNTSPDDAMAICHRFKQEIEKTVFGSGEVNMKITVSIGLIPLSADHNSHEAFLHAADRNMYLAKQQGKNCIYYN